MKGSCIEQLIINTVDAPAGAIALWRGGCVATTINLINR